MENQTLEAPTAIQSWPLINDLGQGFNIYGTSDSESIMQPLFDFAASDTKEFEFNGTTFLIPTCVNPLLRDQSNADGQTYSSREEIQDVFSANLQVSAQKGAFSGEVQAGYDKTSVNKNEIYMSYFQSFNHSHDLQLVVSEAKLNDSFRGAIEALPGTFTPDTIGTFAAFFTKWGAYYVQKVVIGWDCSVFTSTKKSFSVDTQAITAKIKAQVKLVLGSGSGDASLTTTSDYKNWLSASSTRIIARGGDSALAARVASVSVDDPNGQVQVYNDWVASAAKNPTVVNYQLDGIWNLCGEKQAAVQDAWQAYSTGLHAQISVETIFRYSSGNVIPITNNLPTIALDKPLIPKQVLPDMGTPVGFQTVVLKNNGLINSDAVVMNNYYVVDSVTGAEADFTKIFDDVYNDLTTSGFMTEDYTLVLATIGTMYGTPPITNNLYSLLSTAGAGDALAKWHTIDGSSTLSYVLIGNFGIGKGNGSELFCKSGVGPRVYGNITVEANFFTTKFGLPAIATPFSTTTNITTLDT